MVATGTIVAIGLLLLRATEQREALSHIAQATQLCFALSLVTGAVLLLCRWHLLDQVEAGWMAAALTALAIYVRPEFYLAPSVQADEVAVTPADVACMGLMLGMTHAARRQVPATGWRNPVVLGVSSGLLLTALRTTWIDLDLNVGLFTSVAVTLLFPFAAFVCARWILASEAFPLTHRWHLVVPLALGIGCYHFVPATIDPLSMASLLVIIVCAIASISTTTTSVALLQDAFLEQRRRLARLADRAVQAEDLVNHDAELRHECRATLAGISSASQLLMADTSVLGADQSLRLREMLNSELARLQSLLDPQAPGLAAPDALPPRVVDLDELLEPLFLALTSRGVEVDYQPTRAEVEIAPETLASTVLAVVGNAERHAPGARVRVWTTMTAGEVHLHIADDGPGIGGVAEDQIFERGQRGDSSPGEGLGLFTARRNIRRDGGDLLLEPSESGARFAVILPRAA